MNFLIVGLFSSILEGGVNGQVPDTTSFQPALTSFTCHGRPPGYYADLETGCKTYHVCDGHSHFTYICPKRTLFQQRSRICDHAYLVRCEDSLDFYEPKYVYSDDEGEILFPFAEPEEDLLNEDEFRDNYNDTNETVSTETTQTITETTFLTTDHLTEVPPSTTPSPTPETLSEPTSIHSKENFSSQTIKKFLKIRLKDSRSLFFIPEFEDNSIGARPDREFLLPVENGEFMKFKNRKGLVKSVSLCPSYCNPKYFLPETCHPCIMIK